MELVIFPTIEEVEKLVGDISAIGKIDFTHLIFVHS
jgi:hypothetical protein